MPAIHLSGDSLPYYRYTLDGHHSPEVAQAMLGAAASHGLIVRVDAKDNQTHVFIAADGPAGPTQTPPAGVRADGTVSESELLRIP